jgi:hypothetical protein
VIIPKKFTPSTIQEGEEWHLWVEKIPIREFTSCDDFTRVDVESLVAINKTELRGGDKPSKEGHTKQN